MKPKYWLHDGKIYFAASDRARGPIFKDIDPQKIREIVERIKAVKWPMIIDVTATRVPDPAALDGGDDGDE